MNYQRILDEIAEELATAAKSGAVADYIPELGNVDPDQFGIAVHCVDGQSFSVGDVNTRFSIQSMAKVLTLALAGNRAAPSLWKRVGVEPSGSPFNSLVQLEHEAGIPRNPFINAGALVVADLLVSELDEPKQELLAFVRELSGVEDINYDSDVAASEFASADRNRALVYFMKSFGNIDNDVETVLDFYTHKCALAMTCAEVARTYSFLAHDGLCSNSNKKILGMDKVRRINALMLTCGFYDESGDFAFEVGLPGKSGVGGGIVGICPNQFSIAAWSPRLGPKGNSVLATDALRLFATRTKSSIF